MISRESFLERVRQAAKAGRAHRVHLSPVPPDVGYIGVEGDLCTRFAAEVEAVGGMPLVVDDHEAATQALGNLLDEIGPRGSASALCWQHELLSRLRVEELLAIRAIVRHDYVSLAALPEEHRRQAMLDCAIGITSCDLAIAETGSLLMCSRSGRERVASLLPPVHVAIVERRQIVPDLMDAIAFLGGGPGTKRSREPAEFPSNAVLITGPSKTGDIELQLTTGVHGPGKWHVIVIR